MEAFKIKNGLSAKRYLGSTTTLSGSTIDLSLASMFSTTLSSDPAYAFTNPPPSGTAQAFSVEVTGGTTTFTQDSFATTLYTGNATSQTITNNFDLSTNGGMIWFKSRTNTYNHVIFDTERWTSSDGNGLFPNLTNAEGAINELTSFNTDGFGVTGSGYINDTNNMVAWSFKKQAKFFDVVTYTGTGSAQNISHNLGSVPGMIIVKRTDTTADWAVYHSGTGNTHHLSLNQTAAAAQNGNVWNNTTPTSTYFSVNDFFRTGASGGTYVAYLFAHDTASDSRIKCGSYTGNSSTDGPEINLGWQPQWLLIKDTTGSQGSWVIFDTARGIVTSDIDPVLQANLSNAEYTGTDYLDALLTGFKLTVGGGSYGTTQDTHVNYTGHTYIYMAIRASAATDSAITWPSSVKWPAGVAPTTPAAGTKDLFTFLTTDGGTTYYGKKAAEGLA